MEIHEEKLSLLKSSLADQDKSVFEMQEYIKQLGMETHEVNCHI